MKYLIDYGTCNNMKGGGCFDVWCPLCGGPLNGTSIERSESLYEESLNKNIKKSAKLAWKSINFI